MKLKGIILIAILFISTNVFAKNFFRAETTRDFDVTFEEKTYSVNDNVQTIILEENVSENLMPLIWYSATDSEGRLLETFIYRY